MIMFYSYEYADSFFQYNRTQYIEDIKDNFLDFCCV